MGEEQLLVLPENEILCALLSGANNSTTGISNVEGQHLAWLASKVPANLSIVEIGSHKGKSTAFLAAGARAGNGAHVYAIDLWMLGKGRTYSHYHTQETWEMFLRQTEPYHDLITPVRMDSLEAARRRRRPIGLLFIDADHHYEPCLADYRAWHGFIPSGSYIAFHDYTPRYGVKRVIDEVVVPSGLWTDAHQYGRIWSARRR